MRGSTELKPWALFPFVVAVHPSFDQRGGSTEWPNPASGKPHTSRITTPWSGVGPGGSSRADFRRQELSAGYSTGPRARAWVQGPGSQPRTPCPIFSGLLPAWLDFLTAKRRSWSPCPLQLCILGLHDRQASPSSPEPASMIAT